MVLEFDHCGYVYQGSFVMFDKQTESEWLHVTAECVMGPLKGKSLDMEATRLITWKEWKALHPKTTVMAAPRRWEAASDDKRDFAKDSLRPKLGLNVVVEHQSKLYPYSELEPKKVINDEFQKTPLAAVYVPQAACAVAWERRVDGEVLTFDAQLVSAPAGATDAAAEEPRDAEQANNKLLRFQDTQTGSVWDPLSGKALCGPLKGKQLQSLIAIPIRVSRYRGLYPDGAIYLESKPE